MEGQGTSLLKDTQLTFLNFRNCPGLMKDYVPLLTSYEALKSQFDWLTNGGISRVVEKNLGRQLKHLELFLRYKLTISKNHVEDPNGEAESRPETLLKIS